MTATHATTTIIRSPNPHRPPVERRSLRLTITPDYTANRPESLPLQEISAGPFYI
jgi:hypothetical protein